MPFPEQWTKSAIESAAACQAYPLIAPEAAALPYVVYGRTSTDRGTSLPMSPAVAISPSAQFQIEIYAATYFSSKTLADLVRQAMHNFTGTAYGVTIRSSLLVEERDGDPVFFDGQDKPTFSVEQTYQIRWEE
jgi:hypothetical protein